ncbi:MAG: acyl-CoA/acyl-ACP dehydrogenase [Candidatus Rokubacteria bacterium]|nr:acyl-CoA/acyl-ACP dehydrogenase [Candidatus Rokubacteria bacterium]
MDFDLTDEQRQLRDSVRAFMRQECTRDVVQRALAEGRHSERLWRRMAEMGWLGVAIDERYGGAGGNIVDMAIIVEALAPGEPAIGPYFATVCFGGKSVGFFGSEAQKRFYLPRITAGECVFSLSITEPGGGTDVLGAMQTHAERDGDGWVLNGAKMFTSAAQRADYIVVVARTTRRTDVRKAAEGVTLFIVPRTAPGVTVRKIETIVPIEDTNAVFYDNVRLPADAVLGEEGRGFYQLLATLNNERILGGAAALGCGVAAYDAALAYARERTAFGKIIGQMQAIQHYLADMTTELDAARLLVYRAAWLQSEGRECGAEATMAKMYAADVAVRACDRAIQIHGGMGLTEEVDVARYWRLARLWQIGPITNEQCRNIIAQMRCELPRSY